MDQDPLPPSHEPEPPALEGAELERLLGEVLPRTLEATPTWRSRLQEQSTGRRQLIARMGLACVGAVATLGQGLRADWADVVRAQAWLLSGLMLALVLLPAWVLRPMHASPRPRQLRVYVASALLLPPLAGLLPWPGTAIPLHGEWIHLVCAVATTLTASCVAAVLLVLDRADAPSQERGALAAGLGGILGFISQGLHCSVNGAAHLALAHGMAGVAAACAVMWWFKR